MSATSPSKKPSPRSNDYEWAYCADCDAWTGGPYWSRNGKKQVFIWGSFDVKTKYTKATCFWCGTKLKGKCGTPPSGFRGATLKELLADED
jgi:hypothetical protein